MNLTDLVALARKTPFYSSLYAGLGYETKTLEDLPIARFADVMTAVHKDFRALCVPGAQGLYFTTSGTTGKPKAILFGRHEFRHVHQRLAQAHAQSGALVDGDVLCCITEPGSASFMAIHEVAQAFPGKCSIIPIGSDVGYPAIMQAIEQFGASVILGMNPTLLGLADVMTRAQQAYQQIRMLLGGGELFYGAQLSYLKRAFPQAAYTAFMYGALETGLIGHGIPGQNPNEVQILDDICTVELWDPEQDVLIRTPGQIGHVLITSLSRQAAPAIRLETGDLGAWKSTPTNSPARLTLHGRAFPFRVDVDGRSLCEDDIWSIVRDVARLVPLLKVQLVLSTCHRVHIVVDEKPVRAHESATIRGMFARLGLDVRIEEIPLAAYEAESKRKSRLIVDERRSEP